MKNGHHLVADFQRDFNESDELEFEVLDKISSPAEAYKEYEAMDRFHSRERGAGYNYRDSHRFYRKPEPIEALPEEPTRAPVEYKKMKFCSYRELLIGEIMVELSDPEADVAIAEMIKGILIRDREFREGKLI